MPYDCWLCGGHITLRTSDDVFILQFGVGCVLKGCFERGIFWRAKSRLKGIENFNLEHWERAFTYVVIWKGQVNGSEWNLQHVTKVVEKDAREIKFFMEQTGASWSKILFWLHGYGRAHKGPKPLYFSKFPTFGYEPHKLVQKRLCHSKEVHSWYNICSQLTLVSVLVLWFMFFPFIIIKYWTDSRQSLLGPKVNSYRRGHVPIPLQNQSK